MNQIERNVYVLDNNRIKQAIDYVRATNTIPIIFHFRDYNIPSAANAKAFIAKPSGKAVYAAAEITGNDVNITVSTQMFAELGINELQIKIESDEKDLVTFTWPVMVHKNLTEGDIPPSKNESGFFSELRDAADDANAAADSANKAAQETKEALDSIKDAVQGTLINDGAPSEHTVYSSRKVENKFARIEATLGYECKNLIPYPYDEKDKILNGITWTDVGDGTVMANGVATEESYFNTQSRGEWNAPFILKKGKYVLTGCPSGGGVSKCQISAGYTNPDDDSTYVHIGADYGEGLEFELTKDVYAMRIQLVVRSGFSAKNLTFKPMIRIADVRDSTWEPYIMPQKDTNDNLRENDVLLESTLGYHCKNLLPYPYNEKTGSANGVTFTDDGDGSITVNGTATENAFFNCQARTDTESPFVLKKGKYILSGCPSGGADGTYALVCSKTGESGVAQKFGYDTGNGLLLDLQEDVETTQVQIIVWKGTTVNNLLFRPMIRRAEIKNDTWEEYKPSVEEQIEQIKNHSSDTTNEISQISNSLAEASEAIDLISARREKGFINTCESGNASKVGFKYKTYQYNTVPITQIDNTTIPLIRDLLQTEIPITGIYAKLEGSQWYLCVVFYATGSLHERKIPMN